MRHHHKLRHQHGEATPVALLTLLIVLAAAWLLWSGIYKPLVIGLGAFSCILTLLLARQMGFFENSSHLEQVIPRLPGFWLWLGREIVKSSWDVAKIVLSPNLPIQPSLVRIRSKGKMDISQTILGNSITLSPGTVTLDVHEGELLVHCLTEKGAEDLLTGEVNQRVANLERDS